MKKKKLMVALSLCVIAAFTGCSKKSNDNTLVDVVFNNNADDYITVGEYEGIKYKTYDNTVTDADVEEMIQF